jgi:hypothetical protein
MPADTKKWYNSEAKVLLRFTLTKRVQVYHDKNEVYAMRPCVGVSNQNFPTNLKNLREAIATKIQDACSLIVKRVRSRSRDLEDVGNSRSNRSTMAMPKRKKLGGK